jgi:hypothetical protein
MTAMPVTERMTAEEFLARPYDPRERGAELIGGVIVVDDPLVKHQHTAADEVLVYRRSHPDAADFDIALELGRGDALTSPQLPGFPIALRALLGE